MASIVCPTSPVLCLGPPLGLRHCTHTWRSHSCIQLLKRFGDEARVDIVVSHQQQQAWLFQLRSGPFTACAELIPCSIFYFLGNGLFLPATITCSSATPVSGPTSHPTLLSPSQESLGPLLQEALPTPFGLVRSGVAPDHPDTKVSRSHAHNPRCLHCSSASNA